MEGYILLKIRRGLKADLPTLSEYELGYCTDTKELFIGTPSGNVLQPQYNASNISHWATPPTSVMDAVDRLASAVYGLNGGTPL